MATIIEGQLSGYTIGVTADQRALDQVELLVRHGAECVYGPTTKVHPYGVSRNSRPSGPELLHSPPDLVVVMSGRGFAFWLELNDSLGHGAELREALSRIPIYVAGQRAAGAVVRAGLDVAWKGSDGSSDGVLAKLAELGVSGQQIAVQADVSGASSFKSNLEELGAKVLDVKCYDRGLPEDMEPAERLVAAVCERRIDALTFTSRGAVDGFFDIASRVGRLVDVRKAICSGLEVFCIGPVCAAGLSEQGLAVPRVPESRRLGALSAMVADHFGAEAATFNMAGVPVRLQGRLALVGGQRVMLSDRERSLLDVLVERPGVVHSKRALLMSVWPESKKDEHVVEVTVGRLRQRLGVAGIGIETVMRRGYRVSEF